MPPPRKAHTTRDLTGFTLAEVLITLGIIGVVAAMTMPSIIQNVQMSILRNQFKKAYNTFTNAVAKTRYDMGEYDVECYYWMNNPYGAAKCNSYNEYNECNLWTMADDSPLISGYNGPMSECVKFHNEFKKQLTIVNDCPDHAYDNGCAPLYTYGRDFVSGNPSGSYSVSALRNTQAMYVSKDGMIFMPWDNNFGMPNMTIDVNGKKGPNKWGYDIYSFALMGDNKGSVVVRGGSPGYVQQGGKSAYDLIVNITASK